MLHPHLNASSGRCVMLRDCTLLKPFKYHVWRHVYKGDRFTSYFILISMGFCPMFYVQRKAHAYYVYSTCLRGYITSGEQYTSLERIVHAFRRDCDCHLLFSSHTLIYLILPYYTEKCRVLSCRIKANMCAAWWSHVLCLRAYIYIYIFVRRERCEMFDAICARRLSMMMVIGATKVMRVCDTNKWHVFTHKFHTHNCVLYIYIQNTQPACRAAQPYQPALAACMCRARALSLQLNKQKEHKKSGPLYTYMYVERC